MKIKSYNFYKPPSLSSRVFPWVLEVFDISAYHFYKLIEVAIKVEPHFSRGIIKHLNWVSVGLDTDLHHTCRQC